MSKNVFIVEDNEDDIVAYKILLKDFNLYVFDDIVKANDFLNSDDFKKIEVAIFDVNLGEGLKISGFNLIYQIVKKHPKLPIIICTAHRNNASVERKAKLVGAALIEKPISKEIIDKINDVPEEKKEIDVSIGQLEQQTREFMSATVMLKFLLSKDLSIPLEYIETLDKLEDTEEIIIKNINSLKENEAVARGLLTYVETTFDVLTHTLDTELNLEAGEIEFIEEMRSLGHDLLQRINDTLF